MPKKSPKKPTKLSLLSGRNLLVLGGVFLLLLVVLFFARRNDGSTPQPANITTADGKKVDLSPPTAQDKQAVDAHKDEIVQRDQQLSGSSSSSTPTPGVSVVITDVSTNNVKSYVSGVFEDGGTCSATATQGAKSISGTSAGFKNVSYTQCAPIAWSSQLTSGSWDIKVNYKSITTDVSQEKTVTL
jgi:cytoskeletal protein RodZ